jgi:hypothetical protein
MKVTGAHKEEWFSAREGAQLAIPTVAIEAFTVCVNKLMGAICKAKFKHMSDTKLGSHRRIDLRGIAFKAASALCLR